MTHFRAPADTQPTSSNRGASEPAAMYMFSTMEEQRYQNFVSLTPSTEQCCHMLCPKWRGLVRAELGTSSVNRLERMKSVQLQKN